MSVGLAGKAAIVTGAAQGLGYAISKAYVTAGMRVALLDVKADLLQSVQAELGANSTAFTVDLSDGEHTQAVAQQAVTWCGVPSVLVHNAAILVNRPLLAIHLADFQRELAVIIQAAFILTQAVWEPMTAAGGGSIVFVSSRSGVVGFDEESPYVAGKHALEGFMKCMAIEGKARQIAVNTITPGMYMHTPMSEYNYSEALKQQWIDPMRLTPAFLTLATQDGRGISGERLNAWHMSQQ
jgi:NAD(P)-dependent dehydrogenase (short-subunit alcohol dehydrogenase family)